MHSAFDGRTGSGQELVDAQGFRRRYGRSAEGGEVGCLLSHMAVLKEFAGSAGDTDDLLLVAEDDAVFGENFERVLTRIEHRARFDFALLAFPHESEGERGWDAPTRDWAHMSAIAMPVGPYHRPCSYRIGRYWGGLWGAGLYLVSREGARKLTRRAEENRPDWVADDFEAWHRSAGLDVQFLRPNLCGWIGDSEIGGREGFELETGEGIKYEIGRAVFRAKAVVHATADDLRWRRRGARS